MSNNMYTTQSRRASSFSQTIVSRAGGDVQKEQYYFHFL